ncbi:MAG: hypothetical protein Ct9H300mP23_05250 [Nitrospinota bacterium]|nr:MAG: hypothetical protein Ct9H300mP23_05250 [Nitrospinota bacterium]
MINLLYKVGVLVAIIAILYGGMMGCFLGVVKKALKKTLNISAQEE